VFEEELCGHLPERVLPVSTKAPTDLSTLFANEADEIKKLLGPGTRRGVEAKAKLRSLAIVEGAFSGEKVQPSESELNRVAKKLTSGRSWTDVFPGVSAINFTTEGYGPSIDLKITKGDGIPVYVVPEGTPGASTVAVRRVNELGFYNLGRDQLATTLGLTGPKTTAFIRYLDLQSDPDSYKLIKVGKTEHHRYSQKAIQQIKRALQESTVEAVWESHGPRKRG